MMICTVVKSPFTEPSFLISTLPFIWTLPFTLPYTITSPAMMSAVNFAVAPTATSAHRYGRVLQVFRRCPDPRCPRFRLSKCRLDPSRDGARPAVPPGRVTSSFILVGPSQNAGTGFGGFVCRLVGSGSAACLVSGFFLFHIGTSLGTTHTKRVGAAMFQVSSLVS